MAPPWSVYVLRSKPRGHLYTGIALDVTRRLSLHNAGKGAKRTRASRPWEVVYVETGHTRSSALKREREIKKMRREKKLALIAVTRTGSRARRRTPRSPARFASRA